MLAILAQHQPVTRAEIEDILGVPLSQAAVDIFLEAGLTEPNGVKDAPGMTTPGFAAHFGLRSFAGRAGCRSSFAAAGTGRGDWLPTSIFLRSVSRPQRRPHVAQFPPCVARLPPLA